ncbi:hypothetical protein PSAB6_290047 [Paraburkholderia sabiae]|nr:hypothetical protein PSAB6_290047 [Paraburkholderia sabiae]
MKVCCGTRCECRAHCGILRGSSARAHEADDRKAVGETAPFHVASPLLEPYASLRSSHCHSDVVSHARADGARDVFAGARLSREHSRRRALGVGCAGRVDLGDAACIARRHRRLAFDRRRQRRHDSRHGIVADRQSDVFRAASCAALYRVASRRRRDRDELDDVGASVDRRAHALHVRDPDGDVRTEQPDDAALRQGQPQCDVRRLDAAVADTRDGAARRHDVRAGVGEHGAVRSRPHSADLSDDGRIDVADGLCRLAVRRDGPAAQSARTAVVHGFVDGSAESPCISRRASAGTRKDDADGRLADASADRPRSLQTGQRHVWPRDGRSRADRLRHPCRGNAARAASCRALGRRRVRRAAAACDARRGEGACGADTSARRAEGRCGAAGVHVQYRRVVHGGQRSDHRATRARCRRSAVSRETQWPELRSGQRSCDSALGCLAVVFDGAAYPLGKMTDNMAFQSARTLCKRERKRARATVHIHLAAYVRPQNRPQREDAARTHARQTARRDRPGLFPSRRAARRTHAVR